jgi:hypothetical protein
MDTYTDNKFIFQKNFQELLTPMFCQHVINKFEEDVENQQPGAIGAGNTKDDIKRSTDLFLSNHAHWYHEHQRFQIAWEQLMQTYAEHIREEFNTAINPFARCKKEVNSGFQIQRTRPGEFYKWHSDEYQFGYYDELNKRVKHHDRGLTYIFYLNTIEHDGYTEFYDGTKIKPEECKGLMFPATWTFSHRGFPPKDETKYIVTGWTSGVTFFDESARSTEIDWKYPFKNDPYKNLR